MNNRRSILTLACILTLASLGEARADGPRLSRKVASYIALGAGGWLLSAAYQARREANRADERYERAESKSDAQIFYDERRRFDTRAVVMGAMGLGAVAWSVKGADRGWMTSRRAWGWALCGGSAILLVKSWDFRQQGDDAYRRYQKASTPQEAERFLDRANSRDTQSQMRLDDCGGLCPRWVAVARVGRPKAGAGSGGRAAFGVGDRAGWDSAIAGLGQRLIQRLDLPDALCRCTHNSRSPRPTISTGLSTTSLERPSRMP